MQWNEKFKLSDHGDRFEKRWWSRVETEFLEYADFWRKHIVPLTNRIFLAENDEKWEFLRDDVAFEHALEKMVMAQYSTFYYFYRATEIIDKEGMAFVEDAFLFLFFAVENLDRFARASERVFKRLRGMGAKIPEPGYLHRLADGLLESDVAGALRLYRNVYAHYPTIGRSYLAQKSKSIPVPKSHHLPKGEAPPPWSSLQKLDEKEFEDAQPYLQDLRTKLLLEMKNIWVAVDVRLTAIQATSQYRELYKLRVEDCTQAF